MPLLIENSDAPRGTPPYPHLLRDSDDEAPAPIDHGDLLGLLDDDHTQYLLADGSRGLSGDWNIGQGRKLLLASDIYLQAPTGAELRLVNEASGGSIQIGAEVIQLVGSAINLVSASAIELASPFIVTHFGAALLVQDDIGPFTWLSVDTAEGEIVIGPGHGKVGFFGATPVEQAEDFGNMFVNTGGADTGEVLETDDAIANDNFATLANRVNAIRTILRNYGLMA